MADAILAVGSELRGRSPVWEHEEGVIAEAVRAARRARDLAVPEALGDERPRIFGMAREDHHAAVVGAPIVLELGEQAGVIARIAFLPISALSGVVGRVHA